MKENVFTDYEESSILKFQNEHKDCYKNSSTPLRFTIHQSWGSGIGITTTIICDCCGEKQDVTDYNMW